LRLAEAFYDLASGSCVTQANGGVTHYAAFANGHTDIDVET